MYAAQRVGEDEPLRSKGIQPGVKVAIQLAAISLTSDPLQRRECDSRVATVLG